MRRPPRGEGWAAISPPWAPIQPIIIGDSGKAMAISAKLRQLGILVGAIRPPTVPAGSARLRITLTAAHTAEQVQQLLDGLAACQLETRDE